MRTAVAFSRLGELRSGSLLLVRGKRGCIFCAPGDVCSALVQAERRAVRSRDAYPPAEALRGTIGAWGRLFIHRHADDLKDKDCSRMVLQ